MSLIFWWYVGYLSIDHNKVVIQTVLKYIKGHSKISFKYDMIGLVKKIAFLKEGFRCLGDWLFFNTLQRTINCKFHISLNRSCATTSCCCSSRASILPNIFCCYCLRHDLTDLHRIYRECYGYLQRVLEIVTFMN